MAHEPWRARIGDHVSTWCVRDASIVGFGPNGWLQLFYGHLTVSPIDRMTFLHRAGAATS